MVGVESVRPHPKNPRQGDVGAICESIEANGFYGAIVAQRSTGFVLAGNHRLMAAKAQGLTEIPCVWVDVDDDRALRILLADNRTNDLASYDDTVLAALLSDLANTSDLVGTGYDGDDLDELIADLARGDGLAGAIGGLPNGDKEPFQQMTFTLHDNQAVVVQDALALAKKSGRCDSDLNENSNGNALFAICEEYVGKGN